MAGPPDFNSTMSPTLKPIYPPPAGTDPPYGVGRHVMRQREPRPKGGGHGRGSGTLMGGLKDDSWEGSASETHGRARRSFWPAPTARLELALHVYQRARRALYGERFSEARCPRWRGGRSRLPRPSAHAGHACGFKLANDGVDTRALQAYLGHRSI